MYEYVDAAVVRAPVGLDGPVPWPELADPHATAASWKTWLQQVWQIGGFAAAVEVASPDLARQVGQICAGRPVPDHTVRRTVLSVLRYLLRASGRATPFGLFAGVAPARIGAAPALRVGTGHRTMTRPAAAWTTALIERMEDRRELRPSLMLVANDLVVERDGRLVLEHRPGGANNEAPVQVRIRATTPTRVALDNARDPILWADLADKMSAIFRGVSRDAIDQVLAVLVAQRFLITGLRPATTVPAPFAALLDEAERVGAAEAVGLREVAADLARSDAVSAADPATARAERAGAAAAMTRLLPQMDPAFALDLRLDWDVVIPEAVAAEAASAATVLSRLAPRPALSRGWADWHRRFVERFGPGAMVPVLDAVDLLGYPSGYLGSTAVPLGETPVTDRDRHLLTLAHTAAVRRRLEVWLDDAAIEKLAVVGAEGPVQPSTELTVRVHAASVSALDRGDFTLHVGGVARAAGTTTGRFLPLFDAEDRRRMTELYAGLPGVQREALSAQLSTAPLYVRAEHVARAPQATDLAISLGEHRGTDQGRVGVEDLAVTADAEQLHLVSLSCRRPVHTTLLNAVDLSRHTHPLARMLFEAPVALSAPCAAFSWGPAASALPFLPALRYGRTVLSPARWRLDRDQLPTEPVSWSTWDAALSDWRRTVCLPERVYLGDGDRRVSLDLAETSHRALLRTHLERDDKVLLRPAPDAEDLSWTGGRAHEIVIPMAATGQATAPVRWPGYVVRLDHGHPPGCDDRLYLKLYGRADLQDSLLTKHLPAILDDLRPLRWWFVRYRDPEEHLRIRLAVPPGSLGSAVVRVGAWIRQMQQERLITHACWDTYYPETARFGGAAAIDAAEDVFAADSAAALTQLAAQAERHGPDMRAVTAASLVDIAVGLIGTDSEAMRWLIAHTRTDATAPPRVVYAQAVSLAVPVAGRPAGTPLDESVTASWSARRAALAGYRSVLEHSGTLTVSQVLADLLHLHHVRMSGPGLPEERAHLHLARAAALSWTARRNRRTP